MTNWQHNWHRGHRPFDYRWAALRLRKEAKKARSRAAVLKVPQRFSEKTPLEALELEGLAETPGLYLLSAGRSKLYVGEAVNLRRRLSLQFAPGQLDIWTKMGKALQIQTLELDRPRAGKLAWQSCLVKKYKQRPPLNYFELRSA